MPEIEIRPAVLADIPLLCTLDHSYQSNYVWQMELRSEGTQTDVQFREVRLPRSVRCEYPHPAARLAEEWQNRPGLLVGCSAGRPVGYISITDSIAQSTAWVTDLAVAPELRRKGVGSGLLLAGQEWASQRRNRRIIVELQSKNHPAICLMRKLGYEFAGYNDHYYANQDIALFFGQFIR